MHDDDDLRLFLTLTEVLTCFVPFYWILFLHSLHTLTPSMSSSKAALKAIAEAVKQQKFDDAIQQAQDLLQKDTKNYQA